MAFLLMSPYLIHRRHSHIDCSETAEYKTGSIILLPKPLELSPSFDLSRAGNSFKHFKWSTGCTPTSLHNTHTHTHTHTPIYTHSLSHTDTHTHTGLDAKQIFVFPFPLSIERVETHSIATPLSQENVTYLDSFISITPLFWFQEMPSNLWLSLGHHKF